MAPLIRGSSTPAVATHPQRYALGEGPTWDAAAGLVRWVDITSGRIYESELNQFSLSPRLAYEATTTVGAVVPAAGGGLLVATAHEVVFVDESGERITEVEVISPSSPSRLNDGKCDPAGRFVVGTLSLGGPSRQERLVRLEHNGAITVLDDDLTLSNGIDWSPDGGTMYSVDTLSGMVRARNYEPDTGEVDDRRDLFQVADGMPDGLTVDEEGGVWVAIWGGQEVRRYSESGSVEHVVRTDAPYTTSATFAGPSRNVLIVTSSKYDADGRFAGGQSGMVFAAEVAVSGRSAVPWTPLG